MSPRAPTILQAPYIEPDAGRLIFQSSGVPEFVANGGALVSIRDTRIGLARLRTEQTATILGQGGVCLVELEGAGNPPDYEEIANGGPIEVDPVVCK